MAFFLSIFLEYQRNDKRWDLPATGSSGELPGSFGFSATFGIGHGRYGHTLTVKGCHSPAN
jgi:hypothetical protein